MDDLQSLEIAKKHCDSNIAAIVAALKVCADCLKEPQCADVLRNLLQGREVLQKAIRAETEKARRLHTQITIMRESHGH